MTTSDSMRPHTRFDHDGTWRHHHHDQTGKPVWWTNVDEFGGEKREHVHSDSVRPLTAAGEAGLRGVIADAVPTPSMRDTVERLRAIEDEVRAERVCPACGGTGHDWWTVGDDSYACATLDEARAGSLDAAWQEAEAALPKGWRFGLSPYYPEGVEAYAYDIYQTPTSARSDHSTGAIFGDTPAAALRALAAALREAQP